MSRHIFENAVTEEDLISLCRINLGDGERAGEFRGEGGEGRMSRRNIVSLLIVIVFVPATLVVSWALGDRRV